MKIKRLYINNFKSLVNFELIEPNPFSVFVGPNAAGKSNIFEALEFFSYSDFTQADGLFGGAINYFNKKAFGETNPSDSFEIECLIDFFDFKIDKAVGYYKGNGEIIPGRGKIRPVGLHPDLDVKKEIQEIANNEQKYSSIFSRIFIRNQDLLKLPIKSSHKLALDVSNIENVLWRLLQDEIIREEITDWLQLLIPGTEKVEVVKSEMSGDYFLRVFEKHLDKPIGKDLISDGTYNILAILTAVYQSEEPQFLCIEEVENGLNPYVVQELINFFRQMCEEKGHCIWLTTHSPVVVRELQPKEIILIDKNKGITSAKQIKEDPKFKTLKMDEAWLSNVLNVLGKSLSC